MVTAPALDRPTSTPELAADTEAKAPVDPRTAPLLDAPSAIERWFQAKLNRPEDVVFIRVALLASAVVLPLAAAFYAVDSFPWWAALPYWAIVFLGFADKVGLTIHCLIHRRLFKREHKLLEQYIPGFLCMFFGHTPHTFYIHHMGMHHAEGNMWDDTSSTLQFERDNFAHFLVYWWRFLLIGIVDLLRYNWKKGRMKLFRLLLLVEGSYMAGVALLFWWNPAATTVVFLVPVFVMRFAMMAGNWGQHALVCPEQPDNDFRSTVNLIDARHNFRCFNDGYHIVHHMHPSLHFTEMPGKFQEEIEEYVANDAIVFSGLMGFQQLWQLLMLRDYDRLARHYVHLGGPERSHEEIVALLKARTRPLKRPADA